MSIDADHFYRQYSPMVMRRCRRLLADEEQAADAMQDTFVQLLRHQARLDDAAPSSLLYRIATNVCLNRLRSKRRRPEKPETELLLRIADADEPEGRLMARLRLGGLLRGVKTSTRTIAVMHHVDGLTLEEVAAEAGMSVSGVRKRLRKLRAHVVGLERERDGDVS